jgi:hypothetical protein
VVVYEDIQYIILRINCLLKEVIEGRIERRTEVTKRRGRRREARGYWKLTQEALDRTLLGNLFWKKLKTCHKTDYRMNITLPTNLIKIN